MGTITKRGELQWQAKVRRKGYPAQSRTFSYKEDAEKWVRDLERAADTGGLLRDALLFDVYKPKQASAGLGVDEKSLAVRLTLGSADATLTDEQIDQAVKAVVDRIASEHGGRLRS